MNAEFKNVLIIFIKNAVNAVLTNAALMALLHNVFNVYSSSGWQNIGKLTATVVASREAMVWGPIVFKWSTTNSTPPA